MAKLQQVHCSTFPLPSTSTTIQFSQPEWKTSLKLPGRYLMVLNLTLLADVRWKSWAIVCPPSWVSVATIGPLLCTIYTTPLSHVISGCSVPHISMLKIVGCMCPSSLGMNRIEANVSLCSSSAFRCQNNPHKICLECWSNFWYKFQQPLSHICCLQLHVFPYSEFTTFLPIPRPGQCKITCSGFIVYLH